MEAADAVALRGPGRASAGVLELKVRMKWGGGGGGRLKWHAGPPDLSRLQDHGFASDPNPPSCRASSCACLLMPWQRPQAHQRSPLAPLHQCACSCCPTPHIAALQQAGLPGKTVPAPCGIPLESPARSGCSRSVTRMHPARHQHAATPGTHHTLLRRRGAQGPPLRPLGPSRRGGGGAPSSRGGRTRAGGLRL